MSEYKTVLITGASSGFGQATARILSGQGYKLILVARRVDKLKELAAALRTDVHIHALDIRNKKDVQELFKKLPQEFRDVDVLVNNAGLALGLEPAQDVDLEDWEAMVDTNIKGLLYLTRSVLEIMKKRNKGLVVNIGSVAAHLPYRGGNVYGATKAFVKQFSRNLRTDFFGTDLKVTNIEPGMAETEFSVIRFKGDKEKALQVYRNARALMAEDVANTIAWVINQPLRVNIDNIEIMPIDQTFGGAVIHRREIN